MQSSLLLKNTSEDNIDEDDSDASICGTCSMLDSDSKVSLMEVDIIVCSCGCGCWFSTTTRNSAAKLVCSCDYGFWTSETNFHSSSRSTSWSMFKRGAVGGVVLR
jgi:hypothetical protein